MAGLLWGDQPEAAARASLSKCLSNLHDLLGDAVLIERQAISFNRNYPYQLDTERFVASVGAPSTAATIQPLQVALALYRGDFLEGFYVRDAPDFEQWLLVQRAHFREAVVQGYYALATYADQQGDLPQAITYTRRLLALEPWREEAHRQLMMLLARSSQRAAALAQYETCRRILDEELAVAPDAETLAMVEAIRAGDFDKGNRAPAQPVNQPPSHPLTLSPSRLVTYGLPIPPTPLIGRERELAELNELIGNPRCKLITIGGPGGIGKTRLALAAATEQSEKFRHGAVFVPLAGVSTAHFLPQAILTALKAPLQGQQAPAEQVCAILHNQECLLVLDNYEHLLPDVALLLDLLQYAPGATLLVTSRERLALQAEHLIELKGLDYPRHLQIRSDPGTASGPTSYAAIQLFLQRVHQTQRHFSPSRDEMDAIVRICQVAEGMPLALELAAATVYEQSILDIAHQVEHGQRQAPTRLRGLPERHRSMWAAFEHSWQLLSEQEQRTFGALSVFRGGFGAEAAATVAEAFPEILATLVDKSLLRCHDYQRYDMHELVRQYAEQQLEATTAAAQIREGYAAHFLQLAKEAEIGLSGAQQVKWTEQVEGEINNFRAVMTWCIAHAPEKALRIANALHWYWRSRGYIREGREWLYLVLNGGHVLAPGLRADALSTAGFLSLILNDVDQAAADIEQSIALYQELDSRESNIANGFAHALARMAAVALCRGDYQAVETWSQQALEVGRRSNARWSCSVALFHAGDAAYLQGDFARAQACYEESLTLCEAVGNQRSCGRRLAKLGHIACQQEEVAQANLLFKKALTMSVEYHDRICLANGLIGLARVANMTGDYQRAITLLAANESVAINESLAVSDPVGRFWPLERFEVERVLTNVQARRDQATVTAAWTMGRSMSEDQAIAYTLADRESTTPKPLPEGY